MQQEPAPPIGLDVLRKRVFGCVGAFVAFLLFAYIGCMVAMRHGEESSIAATNRAYAMAMAQDYKSMDHFVSPSGIQTFQKAWSVNGPITEWHVLHAGSQVFGRPTEVHVAVTRAGKEFVDDVALQDSLNITVVMEVTKDDWDHQRFDKAVREFVKVK